MQEPSQAEIVHQDPSRSLEEASQRRCEMCPEALTGRQTHFCSQACNTAYWDAKHPRVGRSPQGPRSTSIREGLLAVMADGAWHTKADLAVEVRAHEHSVGTRLSELRRQGFRIESDSVVGNSARAHRFRLVLR